MSDKTILTVAWDDSTIETVLDSLARYASAVTDAEPEQARRVRLAREDIEAAERHHARIGMPEFRDTPRELDVEISPGRTSGLLDVALKGLMIGRYTTYELYDLELALSRRRLT